VANIIFSPEYTIVPGFLQNCRRSAGVSQRELARRLKRSQTHVHKIEVGQRRVELIEFCRYISALEGDPCTAFQQMIALLSKVESSGG
jgi:predicted transcriptional regulator